MARRLALLALTTTILIGVAALGGRQVSAQSYEPRRISKAVGSPLWVKTTSWIVSASVPSGTPVMLALPSPLSQPVAIDSPAAVNMAATDRLVRSIIAAL